MTQINETINHDFKKKSLKLSKYNHFTSLNNVFFGFNLLYRTIIRIPPEAYELLDGIININESIAIQNLNQKNDLPEHWLKTLYDTKFIIDEEFDELNYMKFRYFRNLYASDFLSLVILPTLWCNFDCPYCFEFKKPVSMNKNLELALMEWIETNFASKRNLHIAWFGGEPLLKKNTIIRLTKKLKIFCKDIGANYESSITTNGYYFDTEFHEILSELSVSNVQITLDGDKDDHNSSRKKRNGKGSFEKIFENIVSFCEKDYPCKLTIRVNCGDDNYANIPNLLKRFPESVVNKIVKI